MTTQEKKSSSSKVTKDSQNEFESSRVLCCRNSCQIAESLPSPQTHAALNGKNRNLRTIETQGPLSVYIPTTPVAPVAEDRSTKVKNSSREGFQKEVSF